MKLRSKTLGSTAAVGAAAALALATAAPASAVTVPDWPTSRVPVGCQPTSVVGVGSGFNATYDDTITPTITGWEYGGSTSRFVVPPGTFSTSFKVRATQGCSGVAGLLPIPRVSTNGGPASITSVGSMTALSSNAFSSVWGMTGTSGPTTTTGWIEVPLVGTGPRYSQFVLDENWSLVSKTNYAGGIIYASGAWSKQRVYLVLKTTLAGTATKTSVAKGGSVTFAATLKRNGGAAYVAFPSAAVRFQTKLPGKAWTTRATLTTNSSGRVSYTFKPGATQQWRFVRAENITVTPYTAAVSTVAKTIKVT